MSDHDTGFPPSAATDARILILGSMPGRRSLDEAEYYAHPRNAFWPIMGELFDFDAAQPYEARLQCLRAHGVALWDVAHRCIRPGSLDSAMRDVEANDFLSFFAQHPNIRAIFFNGQKAFDLYRRVVLPGLPTTLQGIERHPLPSTSPAYAGMSLADKLASWQVVAERLKAGSPPDQHP